MGVNLFSFSGFLLFISCLALAFIIVRYGKTLLHRLWVLFNLAVGCWGFGAFLVGRATTEPAAMLWWRLAHVGIVLIPVFLFHVVHVLCGLSRKKLLFAVYLQGAFFLAMIPTRLFISGLRFAFSEFYYATPGPLYAFFFVFWTVIVIFSHYQLLLTFIKSKDIKRRQILYFSVGAILGFAGGVTNFFPVFNINLYPYGNFAIPLYCVVVTYAIFRYKLMEIDVILKKTLVFAGLFASVFAILVLPTLIIQEFVVSRMSFGGRLVGLGISTVLIVLVLRPLHNFLVGITDKYLFQKKYDYKELLRTFTSEVLTVLDLNKLMRLTVFKLADIVKVETCALLLLDEEMDGYRMVASHGLKNKEIFLNRKNTLASFMERTRVYLSILHQGKDSRIPKNIIRDMNMLKVELAIPLVLHERMIGILTLGAKKSDAAYVQDDIDILLPLARTLAIAISNAELFEELLKTQAEAAQREKMAVIGTLSAGINHEICNPLGIVRGQCEAFLLNLKDGFYKGKSDKELIEKAITIMNKTIKEVDRATGVTKRLSSFAKPVKEHRPDEVRIGDEVDEVMALVGHDLKLDKIDVVKDIPMDLPNVLADRKQIEEIFFNLIRNAGQAIGERGRITIRVRSDGNSKVFIDIEDTGHGIPPDKLDQVFNPFYTTKEPGKGTGLGLFIVRQVVEKNKGRISVKSKMGEGTRFRLEFPASIKAEG